MKNPYRHLAASKWAELAELGWDEEDLAGFAGGNWWRFFERSLPE